MMVKLPQVGLQKISDAALVFIVGLVDHTGVAGGVLGAARGGLVASTKSAVIN